MLATPCYATTIEQGHPIGIYVTKNAEAQNSLPEDKSIEASNNSAISDCHKIGETPNFERLQALQPRLVRILLTVSQVWLE